MKFNPEFVSKIFLNLNDKFGKALESRWFKVLVVRCVKKFGWDNSLWLKNSPGERVSFKNREVLIGENSNSNWENIRGSLYVILFTLINVVLEMRKCFNTKLVLDDRFYTYLHKMWCNHVTLRYFDLFQTLLRSSINSITQE